MINGRPINLHPAFMLHAIAECYPDPVCVERSCTHELFGRTQHACMPAIVRVSLCPRIHIGSDWPGRGVAPCIYVCERMPMQGAASHAYRSIDTHQACERTCTATNRRRPRTPRRRIQRRGGPCSPVRDCIVCQLVDGIPCILWRMALVFPLASIDQYQ